MSYTVSLWIITRMKKGSSSVPTFRYDASVSFWMSSTFITP